MTWSRDGERLGGREGQKVEGDEEEFVEGAADEEEGLITERQYPGPSGTQRFTYLVGIVQIQDPASGPIDTFVACLPTSHDQGCIHVDVMAREVQGDETLEQEGPSWPCRRKEDQETRRCATICNHIEDGTKSRRLFEVSRSISIKRVEKARDAVEEGACPRV